MDIAGIPTIALVLILPFLGFLIQSLFGGLVVRKLGPAAGKKVMGALAVTPIALSFALAVMITFQLVGLDPEQRTLEPVVLFNWIELASIHIPFELVVDPLSMTMTLVITGIGALIHLYATGYMAEEKDYTRFFTYLNLFITAMLILVLGNNLALMFIGWEGVGLCSYLLIGFWYHDVNNAKAANKAFIVNRIGDWGFTLGMFMIVAFFAGNADKVAGADSNRWLSYDVLIPNAVNLLQGHPGVATAIALLLFVGAMGKSAQFPLYNWLPDAMAGPTPVSALIHAATMVTAGVFMLNRMSVFFEMTPTGMAVVAIVGAFTALFAALIAFGQTDIKKVLAYSTVSQLGFMFVACGVGAFWVGMFHVITHAFFKALLFLGSGAVIHAMAHDQDMRHYGNLMKYIKITAVTMILGWLAIAGFPLLSGFWSKEAILGAALGNTAAEINGLQVGPALGWLLLVVAALTAAYMTRLTLLTFFGGKEQWRELVPAHGHDAHAHDDSHGHEAHEHNHGHAHEDEHGFFYTDEEMAAKPHEHVHHHELDSHHTPHEVPPSMWVPLAALAALSVLGGFALHYNHTLQHWLVPNGPAFLEPSSVSGAPEGWLHSALLWLSIAAAGIGIAYGFLVYRKGLPKSEADEKDWHPFRKSARDQFGYDATMVEAAVDGGGQIGNFLWKKFDAGLIDGIVNGIAFLAGQFGRLFRVAQTGFVRSYALLMLIGGVALLAWFWYAIAQPGGPKIVNPSAQQTSSATGGQF
ncbi:MAG TPA: NADH-quinone oxidoreductase subunit L [Fimbriimonadaceae bacterium]|nr:NADH-quinone oxidoreductase subunit L [Fimbriimonadaceae bacterium]